MVTPTVRYVTGSVFGVLLCGLGIGLIPLFCRTIHNMIEQQLVISKSSMTYKDWVSPDVPIYMQLWFWDVKNPDEILAGELPHFVEKGPYTYREYRDKFDIVWNSNGTVSYRNKVVFTFEPTMSVGSEDDMITTLNIPLMSVGLKLEMMNIVGIGQWLVDLLFNSLDATVFYQRSVKELTWGYQDPTLKLLKGLAPDQVPSDVFGIFMNKNNSNDGVYTVFTGETDIKKLNQIDMWNGIRKLSHWTTEQANMINGTDGSMNAPFMDLTKPQFVYAADACRSLVGVYEKHVYLKGIKLARFSAPEYVLADADTYPPNIGFCTPNEDHCLPAGLLNASACQQGAPVIYSFPHFLYADPSIMLPDMSPDKEKHQTYVDTDPITGLTMRVAKRLQVNIHLQPLSGLSQTYEVLEMVFPILWLNESTELSDASAAKYRSHIQTPLLVTKIVPWVFIAIGVLLIVLSLIMAIRNRRKSKSHKAEQSSLELSEPVTLNKSQRKNTTQIHTAV
ncbi:lysosome membrane protein 2-like [Saccoglossus kowalevskii]